MITFKELLSTPEYWTTRIQLDLYAHMEQYMQACQLTRTELAQKLGVSKGYVSQVLNGDFDHRLSKLVELSMSIGLVPQIAFTPMEKLFDKESTVGLNMGVQVSNETSSGTTMTFDKNMNLSFSKVVNQDVVCKNNPNLLKAA